MGRADELKGWESTLAMSTAVKDKHRESRGHSCKRPGGQPLQQSVNRRQDP